MSLGAREGQYPVGKLAVLAAEMMPLPDALTRDPAGRGRRADRLAVAFTVQAEHRYRAQRRQLRLRGRSLRVGADPVGDTDLERGVRGQPKEVDAGNSAAQLRWQPVHDEWNDI